MIQKQGVLVPATSTKDLRTIANMFSDFYDTEKLDLVCLVEHIIPKIFPDFRLVIRPKEEMKNNHGLTYPEQQIMVIREDVYLGAIDGNGRDRFTLAHELGHFILHRGLGLARTPSNGHPIYMDSEWQADTFAGELLMPINKVSLCSSLEEFANRFGVSLEAAKTRVRKLKKEGVKFAF